MPSPNIDPKRTEVVVRALARVAFRAIESSSPTEFKDCPDLVMQWVNGAVYEGLRALGIGELDLDDLWGIVREEVPEEWYNSTAEELADDESIVRAGFV